jgi:hypothetical protein
MYESILIDCRVIKLTLSLLKVSTFGEVTLLVMSIITSAHLKEMFKVLLPVNTR